MTTVPITWDTINKGTTVTLSNDNLTAIIPNRTKTVRATVGKITGKWYWEVYLDALNTNGGMVGIVNSKVDLNADVLATRDNVRYIYSADGNKYPENTAYSSSYKAGDTIGVALDLDNDTLGFYKNGVFLGISHTNIKLLGEVYPAVSSGGSSVGNTNTVNFGATSFKYTIPKGYMAYNKQSKILLRSNSKTYSLESINVQYETKMTSNTAPSPLVATASSIYSTTFPAWKAFDGITNVSSGANNNWASSDNQFPCWIQIKYGEKKQVNAFYVYHINGGNETARLKNFTLQGSDNGNDWADIKTYNDVQWLDYYQLFYMGKIVDYLYYRLYIKSNYGFSRVSIAEIAFGYIEHIVNDIPVISRNNFISYGQNEIKELHSIYTNQKYILQEESSKNSEGLWTTQLDRKPLSISFN
ncbi:discoidin domain-containing protein [Lysinibacillus agricola]|uniref:Discoidin domain-containing protein n=1 Tax=Lysinibacillus agricola TaxID=2590012 RepID=A0ABX7ALW5_9BACI|nr:MULTISPECIES: SPRY domain-containing protein [Lysinibacillus]KOS61408.1 hypothetical protein AN161_17575 [Lysinibacillus sp. FJAT-14222]QQP10913.1 discoidin domain-containing protein [Lysinibacillus agricola]